MTNLKNLVQDVVASPLGDVIAKVGEGVAAAQNALDEGSLAAVLDIYAESDDEKIKLLQEIGYRPTFYALPETTGEVRVALRMGQGASGAQNARPVRTLSPVVRAVPARVGLNALAVNKLYATPVDAGYANQFGFQADVSAKLTFKIVPVPAPEGADELRLVPDIAGLNVADASAALGRLGLVPVFLAEDGNVVTAPADDGLLLSQEPAPDAIARLGDEVTLRLASDGGA
ncbi:MAG: PASTA domain-containing protein [Pseudomonadota bacterium]